MGDSKSGAIDLLDSVRGLDTCKKPDFGETAAAGADDAVPALADVG
jgi:hypothetical protein